MAYHNTVFSQLLRFVPRHEFEKLAKRHHVGREFRKTSRWSQFIALATGQCAQKNWRRLRGFNYLAKVITGVKFKDGVEVTEVE